MKYFSFKLSLVITVLILSSYNIFAQLNWTKYSGNPVFHAGPSGSWYNGVWGTIVLFNQDSSRFEMFFSASSTPGGSRPARIGYAKSIDGISWTMHPNPVLTPRFDKWDNYSVENPFVIRENGQYKMWYMASQPSYSKSEIGYASSADGINWSRLDNPILSTGLEPWEAGGVGLGSVIPITGGYKIWYVGVSSSGLSGKACIGYATSSDGISWQLDTLHNPVLEPGNSGQWDALWVTIPRVLYIDNFYYMYYTGANTLWGGYRIGLATSPDGINWTKHPANPILTPSSSGWDRGEVECGTVVKSNDTLFMWYDGSTPTPYAWHIGLAVSTPFIPLPVELTSFTTTSNGREIILNWSTATELNNQGFEILRKYNNAEFTTVGFVKGQGTATSQHQYSFVDNNLVDGKYSYRLKQIDFDGTYKYSNVIEVDWKAFNSYLLEQNYPNPFNPVTTIGYGIEQRSDVKITILNTIGEEVAVVLNEFKDAGYHQIEFNASSASGGLPSGIYFYRLKVGNFYQTKKMIFLK